MKLLATGDLHIRGTSPRNRTDDYKEALKAKLREVFELARQHMVEAILIPGDIFDRPEVSTGVLLEFMAVFNETPVDIYTTPGNHDVYGYSLTTYERTSLRLLELLVPRLHVITDPTKYVFLAPGPGSFFITFTPYSGAMDIDGYGYSPESGMEPAEWHQSALKIHVAHGMLLDHVPPFDRYTLLADAKTTADLVICGHYHNGFGIYDRADGKVFLNPGALGRIQATVQEIERPIQVALITLQDGIRAFTVELLPIRCAAPGDQVLDRSKIEAAQRRQYAMDSFTTLIQTRTGERVLLNVDDIVQTIAAQEAAAPEIVTLALAKINEQKQYVRG